MADTMLPAMAPAYEGDVMRLRKVDDSDELQCVIWTQDMDGKSFDAADPEELDRLIVMTEFAYRDIVKRLRSAGLSKI